METKRATCINVSVYESTLTYGRKYDVIDIDERAVHQNIKIRADDSRVRWYPLSCFDLSGNDAVLIDTIAIRDDIQTSSSAAIEVDITLSNGEQRRCICTTPQALYHYGDTLPGSTIRIHYGHHLIILTLVTEESIAQLLHYLLTHNELHQHTLPIA